MKSHTVFLQFVLSSSVIFSITNLPSLAQPLQGFAEQSEKSTRIERPMDTGSQENIDQEQKAEQSSLVETGQFRPTKQQIEASVKGGQSGYWVNWDGWRAGIADAVWGPLKERRTVMWGMTRVDYDVTHDHHIHITSVHSPDPTGKSGKTLESAIMSLNGSSLLAFPAGSKQTIHHNFNMDMALPMPGRVRYTVHLRGGTEHVVNQW